MQLYPNAKYCKLTTKEFVLSCPAATICGAKINKKAENQRCSNTIVFLWCGSAHKIQPLREGCAYSKRNILAARKAWVNLC